METDVVVDPERGPKDGAFDEGPRAMNDVYERFQLEVSSARRTIEADLSAITRGAVAFAVGLAFVVAGVSSLTVALVPGSDSHGPLVLGLAASSFVLAVIAGALGCSLIARRQSAKRHPEAPRP